MQAAPRLLLSSQLTLPKQIVAELDKHIVGQTDAKRAVAVALRNRWRRSQLPENVKREITPKNILMVGPSGVGKTEIARRLAKLCNAPFVKVEATKYTEVGFHGKDVESMIKDLVTAGINDTKKKIAATNQQQRVEVVEEQLLDLLLGNVVQQTREEYRQLLRKGVLDSHTVRILKKEEPPKSDGNTFSIQDPSNQSQQFLKFIFRSVAEKPDEYLTPMTVKQAREYLVNQESEQISTDNIVEAAIENVEQNGIVFIDEIDKICMSRDSKKYMGDASAEGVQRDLLPLVEGSVVNTPHGDVDTSKILFVASGAFYNCKPSDLLPELQGRFPVRVNLNGLSEANMYQILTEPKFNLLAQQTELLRTDGVDLSFSPEAVREIARLASELNRTVENIGARRLHAIVERITEEISCNCENFLGPFVVDAKRVTDRIAPLLKAQDYSRYII